MSPVIEKTYDWIASLGNRKEEKWTKSTSDVRILPEKDESTNDLQQAARGALRSSSAL